MPNGAQNGGPFRRTFTITILGLVVLVALFAGLNYLQGPKLSSASLDTERAVSQAGQQLRLFANQPVVAVTAKQVSVTPAAAFKVTTSGAVIAVQFRDRLRYSTEYTVRILRVAGRLQPQVSNFDYRFNTASAVVYFLDRADPASGLEDTIVRTQVRGSQRTVVYSARHIQQFVAFPQAIAVTSLAADGNSSLAVVATASKLAEQIQLPSEGTVEQLKGDKDAGIIGFVFTSAGSATNRAYDKVLMRIDLTGSHAAVPVLDLAKRPMTVRSWTFLSSSTSIVAQENDGSVFLIDAAKAATPVPLGQYTELGRGSPDGKTVVVGDVYGRLAYSLSDGTKTRLPTLQFDGATAYGGDLVLVGHGTDRVHQVAVFDPTTGGKYQSYLVYESGSTTRVLYQNKNQIGTIEGFSVSPNGQYLAVNMIADYGASVSDGYSVDPQSTSISTVFVDIAAGTVVSSVTGFDVSW